MISNNPLLRLVILVFFFGICAQHTYAEESTVLNNRHEKIVLTLTSRSLGQTLETELILAARSALPATPEVAFVENPERLVIDVPGVRIRKNRDVDVETSSYVSKIRFGIHPEKLRLVLDLIPGSRPAFQSKLESGKFKLTFRDDQVGNLEKILSEISGDSGKKHQQSFTIPALFISATKIAAPSPTLESITVQAAQPTDKLPIETSTLPTLHPTAEPTPSALSIEILSVERVERAVISESAASQIPNTPPESVLEPKSAEAEAPTLIAPQVIAAVIESPKTTPAPSIAPANYSTQLKALSFGFLGSQRIPIVQIKLSAKANYTFTKESSTSFKLLIDRVSLLGEFLLLPQFPPQEFVGLVMVSAVRTEPSGVAITFAVEDGVKLVTISDANDLLVRAVTR